ncbi:hypothetical protein Pfl01_3063 [Pseudomonas fluorescens Pf0-1]|uniref:Uncharacterized protein n=1 Tax=Pseudomonas fluorescens (strain Pf0-1) TaxID=205922 RepID=Q3KBQ3_PSEPF|nr:hypothetical protein Pfl01_3063 [Pseudomonas fluorescens Pf0-1]
MRRRSQFGKTSQLRSKNEARGLNAPASSPAAGTADCLCKSSYGSCSAHKALRVWSLLFTVKLLLSEKHFDLALGQYFQLEKIYLCP